MGSKNNMDEPLKNFSWWQYPFKPVRVDESIFGKIPLQNYIMESKFDGFRAVPIVGKVVNLWTRERRRIDMPDNLRDQLADLDLKEGTVFDGEIWTPTKRGSWRHNRTVQCRLTLWDVIRSGTKDMSKAPLEERFTELTRLVEGKVPDVSVVKQMPASIENYHAIMKEAETFRASTQSRSGFIHGAVLKRLGSPRRDHATSSTEHPDWMKIIIPGMDSGTLR